MRAPGEAPIAAHLRYTHGAAERPEMWVGERDIDGARLDGVAHLAPVGGDHVGGGRDTGGAAELGHDFAAGVALFGAAGIFGIRENIVPAAAKLDGFGETPGSVRIEGDASGGEARGERLHGGHLLFA